MDPRLTELALKLGTSAEKIWPLIVQRARLEACLGMVFFAFVIAGLSYALPKIRTTRTLDDGDCLVIKMAVYTFIALAVIGILCVLPDAIYPETAAIIYIIRG